LKEAMRRANVEPELVDQVILGNSFQNAENPNVARLAALRIGLPVEVFAYTIDARCASGIQSIVNAAMLVERGTIGLALAGGVESLSRVEFYTPGDLRWGHRRGNIVLYDSLQRHRETAHPVERFGVIASVAQWCNNMAKEHGISRTEQDEWALLSHRRACAAIEQGRFKEEIIPVAVPGKRGEAHVVSEDENPRRDTSLEALSALPSMEGGCTAGNIAVEGDGAAACVVASEEMATRLNVEPLGYVRSFGMAGCDPRFGGDAVGLAVNRALEAAHLTVRDIDLWEIHEVCSAQTLANLRTLGIKDASIVNVNGSGISLAHPSGCSGCRVAITLLHEMRRRQVSLGLEVMPAGGGMALACVFERR